MCLSNRTTKKNNIESHGSGEKNLPYFMNEDPPFHLIWHDDVHLSGPFY